MSDEIFDFSKLSQDNQIKFIGIIMTVIVACIAGCFTLMTAFVQRPESKTESNPTQVVLIINATAIPTLAPIPTFTPISGVTPTITSSASLQPTSTVTIIAPAMTLPAPDSGLPSNNKFSVPWSSWIINFILIMPESTWIFLFISFGVVGLISAIMLFYGVQLQAYSSDKESVRIAFASLLMILVFVVSISKWGWWGVLWGFLLLIPCMLPLSINYLFGGLVGALIGTIVGVSISLFYLAIPGPLDGEIITSGSIIGCVLGILLGAIFIKGNMSDSD